LGGLPSTSNPTPHADRSYRVQTRDHSNLTGSREWKAESGHPPSRLPSTWDMGGGGEEEEEEEENTSVSM
jgi:hypothetical protein